MSDINIYWKQLVSTGLRYLQERGNSNAVAVIKNATLALDYNSYDNWNGGITYWDLVFQLKYKDYTAFEDKKDAVEADILSVLERFHTDERDCIANVIIRPVIEQYVDWNAVLPLTKEETINLIKEEQKMLIDVATGRISFKEKGVEETYQQRHRNILDIACRTGFDYPVNANTLAEWWGEVRSLPSYAERRDYISRMISPLLNILRDSDDIGSTVNFQQIASKSGTVKKAVEDAELFIREGKYDSAVDRIHTAFHGYLQQLLTEHGEKFESNDSITALYTKLHAYYASAIRPTEVGDRVKTILRSAGGMINAVNELRNNNTVAHPNGQLIHAREAQLVIRLVNTIVDYIEDIENDASGN